MDNVMNSEIEEVFLFTDLYIVVDDWESSYCYYPPEKNDIKVNNPPKLITKKQKPYIRKFIREYKKRKAELVKKEVNLSENVTKKIIGELNIKSIFKEDIMENTNITEQQLNKLLKYSNINQLTSNLLKKNIEKYAIEENVFIKNNIKDISMEFMNRHFRIYEMEGKNGKQIVCRQTFNKERKLNSTGISDKIIKYLMHEDLNKGGLIILCGSNGSGKSTTCAAILKERLYKYGGYCITVEDPIEIPLEGQHGDGRCVQLEINPEEGFAPKIREMMRAYPTGQNLMMLIGEIRDSDTASQALRSAIDGRLVITTIHADNIKSALKRLIVLASEKLTEEGAKDLLSNSFRIGIHQSLLSGTLSTDFLLGNREVRNLTKTGDIDKLNSEMERQKMSLDLDKDLFFFD
jgi:Tfp pilus assembly pilus retraction ATPase PilT